LLLEYAKILNSSKSLQHIDLNTARFLIFSAVFAQYIHVLLGDFLMKQYDYYQIICRNCNAFYQKTQKDYICECCGSSKLDVTPIDILTKKPIEKEKKKKK
jgi:Zn finger protein HypA/HybF involved in hydrogenase expression